VVVYDYPRKEALERNTFIESLELDNFEITKSSDRVCVSIDVSQIEAPENCIFNDILFDFKKSVKLEKIYFLGKIKERIILDDLIFQPAFLKDQNSKC
jgi:hypothetical protein